jgi:asparagine synthetase B (glutamine-hydrolysing)
MSELIPLIAKAITRAAFRERSLVYNDAAYVVSGGLDSSTIACVGHMLGYQFRTYTGYYESDGFSEVEYAKLVPSPDHRLVLITPQDFIDHFDEFATHMREPFQGMGAFGQYMVGKRLAADGIKVAISGEGSDELFGGYARLMAVAGWRLPDGYENYRVPKDYPRTIAAALQYDLDRLPDLLAVDDQCMAAHGVTAEAPFTDQAIVDYALALHPRDRVGKQHLKDAVRGIVPDRIIDRTDKMGFPVPLVEWANGPCATFVKDRIGYLPDPTQPWDRKFWYDLLYQAQPIAA